MGAEGGGNFWRYNTQVFCFVTHLYNPGRGHSRVPTANLNSSRRATVFTKQASKPNKTKHYQKNKSNKNTHNGPCLKEKHINQRDPPYPHPIPLQPNLI